MEHGWREIGQVKAPTLYLLGDKDEIIPREAALQAARRLPAGDRTAEYAQGWHLLLRDKQAHNVWADVAAFVRGPNAALPSGAPPIRGTAAASGALVAGAAAR
jgi:alpha-beta hydrolase superfamily lysophospholipase